MQQLKHLSLSRQHCFTCTTWLLSFVANRCQGNTSFVHINVWSHDPGVVAVITTKTEWWLVGMHVTSLSHCTSLTNQLILLITCIIKTIALQQDACMQATFVVMSICPLEHQSTPSNSIQKLCGIFTMNYKGWVTDRDN